MDTNNNRNGATHKGALKPEWVRPRAAAAIFGIGRARIYELINSGKIKSVSLRERGQKHGTRLISYDSLQNYLESLMEEQS